MLISSKRQVTIRRRLLLWGLAALLAPFYARAAEPPHEDVLSNIFQIWSVPRETRSQPHRIRFEALIYYFDAEWNVVCGEFDGRPTILPIGSAPVAAQAGVRVLVDGFVIPSQQSFIWPETDFRILEHNVRLKPQAIPNLTDQPVAWNKTKL